MENTLPYRHDPPAEKAEIPLKFIADLGQKLKRWGVESTGAWR